MISGDGFLLGIANGITSRLSAKEIWEARQDDFTTATGESITGFGSLLLTLSKEHSGLVLDISTEVGKFRFPNHFELNREYVVIQDHWIPLRQDELLVLRRFLIENDYSLGMTVSARVYANLLALKTSGSIKVKIDDKSNLNLVIPDLQAPKLTLKINPYPYQISGIEWLCALYDQGAGGLLGDQMGLGKTLQLIGLTSHIINKMGNKTKILIVVPNSLKENWCDEFAKFSTIVPFQHFGTSRAFNLEDLKNICVVLTTYDVLIRDFYLLAEIEWDTVICDEAHSLKNSGTMRRTAVYNLKSLTKFLATGTPVENQLEDLWSLMDIIRPGILGSKNYFSNLYENELESAKELGDLVKPLIMRRKTKDVLRDLPDDIYIDQELSLDLELASAYESIRTSQSASGENTPMVAKLQILRMFCCYPPIVIPELHGAVDQKSERLLEVLDEIYLNGEDKVIIFTSFRMSADYLHQLLENAFPGIKVFVVDGRTTGEFRSQVIKDFNVVQGFSILIANPRVAGEGLNIVSANHVIHFNREWNPQKENQASARVLRPGQTKKVFIHRFFYASTVEEIINQKLQSKSLLAESALDAAEFESSNKSLLEALTISPVAATSHIGKSTSFDFSNLDLE